MRISIICVINIFLACIVLAQQESTQMSRPQDILAQDVFAIEAQSYTTPEAFHASLSGARAAGGVVTINGCEEDNFKRRWNPQGQPLGEVLNEIVGADPRYRWEKQDGAINLLPASGEPVLLQTQIGEFSIRTSSSLDALNQLKNRAEVKNAMSNLHLRGGLTIIMHLSNSTEFSLHFRGGTLRKALNAIALSKGNDIWKYNEIHCGERNEVTITF
jgi:hypothetical protein